MMRVFVLCAALVFAGCATSERFLWEEYIGTAVAMVGAEKYGRAERFMNLAMGKAEMLGNEERGVTLNGFGELFRRQKRYDEAEDFFKLALALKEETLGPDHPDVAVTLTNLALTYAADGHPEDAGPLLERAREIQDKGKVSPRARVRTLVALAEVYRRMGRADDAMAMDERARVLREESRTEK